MNIKQRKNNVYLFLLGRLELTTAHRKALRDRGLTDEEINELGYRTWPMRRKHLASAASRQFGDDNLKGVAGFYREDQGEWQLGGMSGLAIPVYSSDGLVTAIKLRPDKPLNPTSKYLYLSSNPEPKKGKVKYPNGTKAKPEFHWPQPVPEDLHKLRITEGELKADIASLRSDTYTISVPGVGLWKPIFELLKKLDNPPKEILIAYDSDKDSEVHEEYDKEVGIDGERKYDVAMQLSNFYSALKVEGYNPKIETWDGDYGKGIDDVLASGKGEAITIMSQQEAEDFCNKHSSLGRVGDDGEWLYVIQTKRFIQIETGREFDKEQFSDAYSHTMRKGNPVDAALRNPDFLKVDCQTYEPNKPQLFKQGELTMYNAWIPPKINPLRGSVRVFTDHVKYMLPSEYERDIFLDWLAYCIQSPGKKIHWAMLLQGKQGTGKSYFGYVMRLLLGESNVSNPSNEAIHEPYTGWQRSCSLVVIEELMARGRLELMNKLKPMITQDISVIREMYKPPYEQPNRFNILIFTNHKDAIIIDETDRRYCVLYSPAEPRNIKYYKELWEWTEENKAHLLWWLKQRKLKDQFNPKGHAPMTDSKKLLVQESLPPLEQWFKEGIEGGWWPFMGDIITTHAISACMPQWARGATPQSIGRILRAMETLGVVQLKQVTLSNGQRVRPWAIRRAKTWMHEKPTTIAAEFERWSQEGAVGGDDYNPLLDAKPM